jgi:hypothetical protein
MRIEREPAAAVLQRAADLTDDGRRRCHVMQHPVSDCRVERPVHDGQIFGVSDHEIDGDAGIRSLLLHLPKECFGQVNGDDVMTALCQPERDASGARTDVQHHGMHR